MDRRHFMFLSLVAAAATAFGAERARAQGTPARRGAAAPGARPRPAAAGAAGPARQRRAAGAAVPAVSGRHRRADGEAREGTRPRRVRARGRSPSRSGAAPCRRIPTTSRSFPRTGSPRSSRRSKITSLQLTEIYLTRLKRLNPTLLCAVTIMEDPARAEAVKADAEIKAGQVSRPAARPSVRREGPLRHEGRAHHVGREGFRESHHRRRRRGRRAPARRRRGAHREARDRPVRAERPVVPRPHEQPVEPRRRARAARRPGPASATAAGCVAFGIGTETSGSIVSPTTRCGLSALRPTFGRVSRSGGMVLAWSQDRVGPICRTVEDAAMVFNVIHGVDEKDPSTVTTPFHFDRKIKLAVAAHRRRPERAEGVRRQAQGTRRAAEGRRPASHRAAAAGGGGLSVEDAAAFDSYVQMKAKEIGLDLNTLPEPPRAADAVVARAAAAAGAARGRAGGAPLPGEPDGAGRLESALRERPHRARASSSSRASGVATC